MLPRPLRLLSFVAFVLAGALVSGACGEGLEPAAAEVNGERIPQSALNDELEAMRGNDAYIDYLSARQSPAFGSGAATFNADFVRGVLRRQVYLELVHQEFERQGLEVTEKDLEFVRDDVANEVGGPDIFEQFDEDYQNVLLRRSAEVALLQAKLGGAAVDDAAMRAYYDEHQAEFAQTCVRHMLFAVIDEATGEVDTAQTEAQSADLLTQAQAAHGRVVAGEDFNALAAQLSKDVSNAADGGYLGCVGTGQFVPEFDDAMEATAPGQVSAPVKTQFGHHLIKVDSRGPQPFEQVADQIRDRLTQESSQSLGLFLSDALTKADVEINPRYGEFSRDLQSPGIVPPRTPTTQPVGGGATEEQPINPGG